MENSPEQFEERDPVLWKQAGENEDLYNLYIRRKTLGEEEAQQVRSGDMSPEVAQQTVFAMQRAKEELDQLIENWQISLGHKRPSSRP